MEKFVGVLTVHHLSECRSGHVDVDAAGATGYSHAICACYGRRYVLGFTASEGGFDQRLCGVELVELLVGAHVHVYHRGVGGARNLNHRVAVYGGVGSSRQSVEEAERRYRHQHARGFRKISLGGRGHAGLLLVAEAYETDALTLNHIGCLGDGDAYKAVDVLDTDIFKGACQNVHACNLRGIFRSGLLTVACSVGRCGRSVLHSL